MKRLLTAWAVDPPLVSAALLMSLFGIAMVYSAGVVNDPTPTTWPWWIRQVGWFTISVAAFSTLVRVPLRWIEWAAVPAYVLAVVLLAATLVVGSGAGTASGIESWIALGPLRFQPAEVAKIATILALAHLLSMREEPPTGLQDLLAAGALVTVPLGLVVLQPDLGTAMAFVGVDVRHALLGEHADHAPLVAG